MGAAGGRGYGGISETRLPLKVNKVFPAYKHRKILTLNTKMILYHRNAVDVMIVDSEGSLNIVSCNRPFLAKTYRGITRLWVASLRLAFKYDVAEGSIGLH